MTGAPQAQGDLERRLRQHSLLAEIGKRALSETDLDTLLTDTCRICAAGLDVRFCKVLQYLPQQERLLVRAGVGWHPGIVGRATLGTELSSPAGYALRTGKPTIANHLSEENRFRVPQLLIEHAVERAVNVILPENGRPFGVLEADSEVPGTFSDDDVAFLQGVANLLAVALERRHVEEELRRLNEQLAERVAVEVAERHNAEDALRQAQKMEAIGQLTGGVAHDFNNLLLLITGSLDMIAKEISGNDRLARMIATAQRGAARGAQLTGQLLAFARRQTLRPETRPINEMIAEFDVLATHMLGEAIEMQFQLDPAAGACHVDPAQFGSAVLNLIVNARDAMPDGGRLTVTTGNISLDARSSSRYPEARPIPYVFVDVADTGLGMSPEVLDRATEPFFTTKEPGRGTGLGLSQVYGFVNQSGGFLTIDSTRETGTRVRVYLPRTQAQEESPAMDQSDTRPQAERKTILVVEDDTDVRVLVVEQLRDLGYRALEAPNGQAALEIITTEAASIDLVLTDVVMPGGMSGLDVAETLRTQRPDLKVVLTSGFISGGSPGNGTGGESVIQSLKCPVLSKPYRMADLARVIEQVLDRSD